MIVYPYGVFRITIAKQLNFKRKIVAFLSSHIYCIWFDMIVVFIVWVQYITMEREFLRWTLPGKRFERLTGIHPRDRNILFRGIWLRMARSGVASFIFVGSYFFVIDHLVLRWTNYSSYQLIHKGFMSSSKTRNHMIYNMHKYLA